MTNAEQFPWFYIVSELKATMRAWLLLLAVLATFQPIVQVASTEDITSSFIQAITPSIKEQQNQLQQQQELFELEERRHTRTTYNKNNNNNIQELVASRQLTAISPVSDITALSVTRTQTTKAKTSIATIFSYNKRSDSDKYTINGNNLNTFSAKDNKASESEPISDATKAIVEVKQKKNKINKQITNQKHNEVNDKNYLIEIPGDNNNNNAVQVQQLANTSVQIKSETATKSTKTLKATSAVLSEQVGEEEEDAKGEIKSHNKMAIQEHTLATAQEHSKRHRNHKQHQYKNHQQQQDMLQQHRVAAEIQEQHTAPGVNEHFATAERLATNEGSATVALHTTTTHLAAAEKLARDASKASNTPATTTTASSGAPAASVSVDEVVGDSEDEDVSDVTEPATYSNKEIIGDKLTPDPSTLVQIENSLLSLFNMKRPPKIDRSKIIIPEAMKQLYAQIMGHELDMENMRRPSMLSRSTNTVRSFTHIGE